MYVLPHVLRSHFLPPSAAFLTSAVRDSKANLWISLSYDEVDRKRFLTWTDESPVNYTNWAPGQPSTLVSHTGQQSTSVNYTMARQRLIKQWKRPR